MWRWRQARVRDRCAGRYEDLTLEWVEGELWEGPFWCGDAELYVVSALNPIS